MSLAQRLKRFGLDGYMALLLVMILAGTLVPVTGAGAEVMRGVSFWAIALLFFLYGAKLSTASIAAGLANWRLQGGVLLVTFGVFPVLALALAALTGPVLGPVLAVGIVYVGCLPSTVQSAVAFTSLARGNVAGAVCAASISNLVGVVVAPLLVALLLATEGEVAIHADAMWKIVQQILMPFFAGQLARSLIGRLIERHKAVVTLYDRGSILLIVYVAFSAGTVGGVWSAVGPGILAALVGVIVVLLGLAMAASVALGRLAALPPADRTTLFFSGSTKSLATGLPMAGLLFAGQEVAMIVLPLMLYHLLQLMICAAIAQRAAQTPT